MQIDLRDTVAALGSDDLQQASAAEERLSAIGAPALPALAAALRQSPPAVRLGVVEVLSELEVEGASALLVEALADPTPEVRADAAMALRLRGGAAVGEALGRALDDPHELVRQRVAIACASSCTSPETLRTLVHHALQDPAPLVASTAAASIAALHDRGDEALVRTVTAAVDAAAPAQLADPDVQRRANAAIVLGAVHDARAVPVLEQVAAASAQPRQRLKAIYMLGVIGDASAVPVLKERLDDPATAVYAHDALRRAATRNVSGAAEAMARHTGPQSPVPLQPPT